MNILAFDTCFDACSVAVQRADGVVFAERQLMRRGHAETLLPMIDHTMRAAGITFAELHRIAVTHGPGTFTGVRVGMSAAIGIAFARSIPIVTYSSLQCMARAGIASLSDAQIECSGVVVVRDARRGSVYLEMTDMWGGELAPPALLPIADAKALIRSKFNSQGASGRYFTIGSAISLLTDADSGGELSIIHPNGLPIRPAHAVGVIEAKLNSPGIEDFESPDARYMLADAATRQPVPKPVPLYLRPPDATPSSVPPLARMPSAGSGSLLRLPD